MLRVFFVSIFIILSLKGSSQPEDFEFSNSKGNVKEVTQTYYRVNSNDTVLNTKYVIKFDEKLKTETFFYNIDRLKSFSHYNYDCEKKLIEVQGYNCGLKRLERNFLGDYTVNENVYLSSVSSYTYNSDSTKEIIFKSFYKSGLPKSSHTYCYDFLDNDIGSTKEKYEDEFFYNEKGQLIKQKMAVNEDSSREVHYKYSEAGQLTSSLSYYKRTQAKKERLLTFRYNKHGFLIERKTIDYFHKANITWKYNYIYDKNDNWIKRTSYRNNKIEKIAEREITYLE